MSTFYTWHPRFQWHGSLDRTSPCQRFVLPCGVPIVIQIFLICMGNLLSNHSMVPKLYLLLMSLFIRKSLPRIRSYLTLPFNTKAMCCLITWFLSSSGNCIAWRMTISLAMPGQSVDAMSSVNRGPLGRHFWLMKVTVKPELKSTFNKMHQCTPKMVLHIEY